MDEDHQYIFNEDLQEKCKGQSITDLQAWLNTFHAAAHFYKESNDNTDKTQKDQSKKASTKTTSQEEKKLPPYLGPMTYEEGKRLLTARYKTKTRRNSL